MVNIDMLWSQFIVRDCVVYVVILSTKVSFSGFCLS
jgi:hypothetical protein